MTKNESGTILDTFVQSDTASSLDAIITTKVKSWINTAINEINLILIQWWGTYIIINIKIYNTHLLLNYILIVINITSWSINQILE